MRQSLNPFQHKLFCEPLSSSQHLFHTFERLFPVFVLGGWIQSSQLPLCSLPSLFGTREFSKVHMKEAAACPETAT